MRDQVNNDSSVNAVFVTCVSVSATHKETKQFFTLYNTLDDKKVYLEKEVGPHGNSHLISPKKTSIESAPWVVRGGTSSGDRCTASSSNWKFTGLIVLKQHFEMSWTKTPNG